MIACKKITFLMEAQEDGIGLNWLASDKLSRQNG